jgi:Zn ribbon nucleic-acid-binding protein
MDDKIRDLLNQIKEIEDEIGTIINEKQEQILYYYEDGRISFKEGIEEVQKKAKIKLFRYMMNAKLRNIVSAPFIYSMFIPFLILDISITIYQSICFRLYRIKLTPRSNYVVIDRHQLKHLNNLEIVNCIYCGYGNGVIAYAREVAARTEQYWCPIKHARKIMGRHSKYNNFIDFGDSVNYRERVKHLRNELR